MHPSTTTTTETISWQWPCGTACKMVRQVTTCCPHSGRRWQGTPSAGNPPHHHRHHEQATSWALAAEEPNAGRNVAETLLWVPDPYLMVQQLLEFESADDDVVALMMQLEEYKEEIEGSKRDSDGRNWFLSLPDSVRNVLVVARDAIDSLVAIYTPPAN